jgi:hypothetical protein
MLIVTRRLILSTLLFTAFIGSGFLFGSAAAPARENIGESIANFVENETKVGQNDMNSPLGGRLVKKAGLRWVFFSFGRQGAR